MRRKDREVTDLSSITAILDRCDVCRLGLFDDNAPYIVPLCFGYERQKDQLILYFHSAGEGHKLDLIRKNPNTAFELDTSHHLFGAETACGYGMHFESVMGTGTAAILTAETEKMHAFDCIMAHYTKQKLPYHQPYLLSAVIIAVTVKTICGKVHL